MTKYIITENARQLNIQLMKLSILDNTNMGYFEIINHPDGVNTAFVFRDVFDGTNQIDVDILVHPNCNTDKLIELTTAYTPEQEAELDAYIKSIAVPQEGEEPKSGYVLGRFPFSNLVVGYVPIYDDTYMIENGWII